MDPVTALDHHILAQSIEKEMFDFFHWHWSDSGVYENYQTSPESPCLKNPTCKYLLMLFKEGA